MTEAVKNSGALTARGIRKAFGLSPVLRGVDVRFEPGEIVGLLGENGAGKSTLLNILAGHLRSDVGAIEWNGKRISGWTRAEAIEQGIGLVHQHFALVSDLTALQNFVLGREPTRGLSIDWASARDELSRLSKETGLEVSPDAPIESVSLGAAQRVEILRVLRQGAKVLLLDEPTAVLSPIETDGVFEVLRALRDKGLSIVLVTHKLDEVMSLADRVIVLRKGQIVLDVPRAKTDAQALAVAMVGAESARSAGLGAPSEGDPEEGRRDRSTQAG